MKKFSRHIGLSFLVLSGTSYSQAIMPIPFVQNKVMTTTSTQTSAALQTACGSNGQNCLIVGYTTTATNTTLPLVYTTTDGGNTWSSPIVLSPPTNGTSNVLTGVACDTTGLTCMAVGTALISGGYVPLSYSSTDGGNTWGDPVLPTTHVNTVQSVLSGTSCNSTGLMCLAVGYAIDSNGNFLSLSYNTSDGGTTWGTPVQLISPSGGELFNAVFNVACDGTGTSCLSVGTSMNPTAIAPVSYTSTNGGATWSAPILPAPSSE
ncbi:MAG: WD40/YVTN/BNR-like repeat-containing protein [Legionellales bacterium]